MTQLRKNADIRKKELNLAIYRIERGRAKTKATEVNVTSVAREAGVTPALIHNHYPEIAEAIRVKQGTSSRKQRDTKQNELMQTRVKNKDLIHENQELKICLAKLATINEMQLLEIRNFKAKNDGSKVVTLRPKTSKNR